MSIDMTKHSLFGASKVAADVVVQEYGRYFDMKTSCFRGGTLTGPNHSAAELHGFLAYVMQCTMSGTPYRVFGYKGKQVRDAIHSSDLINGFEAVYRNPRSAEVYNIGGGRHSNCSVREAIAMCEDITGQTARPHLRRGQPHRRPHLVDRQQRPLRGALPRMVTAVRRSDDPRGDVRGQHGPLVLRSFGRQHMIDRRKGLDPRRRRSMWSTTPPPSSGSSMRPSTDAPTRCRRWPSTA